MESLNESLDGCDRGLYLMGHVGYKVATDIFKSSEASHIVENNKCTDTAHICITQNCTVHVKNPFAIRVEIYILFNRLLAG
ncbi:hypothetical protein ES703_105354 [subsurface metagenome]